MYNQEIKDISIESLYFVIILLIVLILTNEWCQRYEKQEQAKHLEKLIETDLIVEADFAKELSDVMNKEMAMNFELTN